MARRGQLQWLQKKESRFYGSLLEMGQFMVSVISSKSSSTQHDDRSVNYVPVYSETEDKAGCAWLPCDDDPSVTSSVKKWK